MKKLILFTLLFLFYQTGNAQIVVASSCYAPDSIVELYQLDADYLTVIKFYDLDDSNEETNDPAWPFPAFAPDSNSIYVPSFSSDSIDVTIPKHLSDSILKALIAVYNATEIPERDSVVDMFNIHTFRKIALNKFYVPGSLLQNGLPSGNVIVDSLALVYELYIENNSLCSPNNLNPYALKNASWEDPTQYPYSLPLILTNWYFYSGFPFNYDLKFKFHEEYTTLIYKYSWEFGSLREWEFRIYPDCLVEFVGATGSLIPQEENTVSIDDNVHAFTKIYPNPNNSVLYVESVLGKKVRIIDATGRVLYTQEISPNNKSIVNISQLKQGNYILHIEDQNGNQIEAKSFVKIR